MQLAFMQRGTIRHRRFHERAHQFSYKLLLFCFDLADPAQAFKKLSWISFEKFNWFSFKRKNYLNDNSNNLDAATRAMVSEKIGFMPDGKIYLLTQLSCLGYCFNPISLYFIFKKESSHLAALLVEVRNTPWGERHIYAHDFRTTQSKNNCYQATIRKAFHVSPFLKMDYQYRFNIKLSDTRIIVHIESLKNDIKHFDATLAIQSVPENKMLKTSLRNPFGSYKTVFAIYWQAMRLWLKGVTFYAYPSKTKDSNNGPADQ